MIFNILQGAATLSLAILVTDAVKETATGGQNSANKWMAVVVVLIMVLLLIYWINPGWLTTPPHLATKNIAVA